MKAIIHFIVLWLVGSLAEAQNVGIGTATPHSTALLHVEIGASLTKGLLVGGIYDANAAIPNLSAGSRLVYYPGKAAFRAGTVDDNQWDNVNAGLNSVAFGRNTIASGYASTTFGVSCISSGEISVAMGNNATASGSNSIAIGTLVNATGSVSTAFGNNTRASGNYSTSMGELTIAAGNYSTAMGSETNASGPLSLATGYLSLANGYASTAMGFGSASTGRASVALGFYTSAKSYGGVAIGLLNNQDDTPNGEQPDPLDRIFQVGNGLNGLRSNALTVLRNGNTGIGVLDPAYRTDLAGRMRIRSGGAAASSAGLWLNRNDNNSTVAFVGIDGSNNVGFYGTGSDWAFVVNTSNGNAWLKGTLNQNSDMRLKKNIQPIDHAVALLSQLSGYHYHWKDANRDQSVQVGLLAQEVEKVIPELVQADDQGLLSVNYTGLIPYLLEAAKEQQATIRMLQTELAELKQLVKQISTN